MSKRTHLPLLILFVSLSAESLADESTSEPTKYQLAYKFEPGEKLYWEVTHRAHIRSTAGGTTKTVESASDSLKVWEVKQVAGNGQVTIVHSVDRVHMRHKSPGREEVVVKVPLPNNARLPLGYESVARDVGVPLTRMVMDAQGKLIRRQEMRDRNQQSTTGYEGPMTIPLPVDPVAVGEKWSKDHIVSAPRKDGTFKRIKLQQRFTLQRVRNNIASIYVESVVLTPVREPSIKVHLVQSKTRGVVRFDIAAGRVIEQKLSLDEEIIGAPLGEASSTHYVMKFTEKYVSKPPQAARRVNIDPAKPRVVR